MIIRFSICLLWILLLPACKSGTSNLTGQDDSPPYPISTNFQHLNGSRWSLVQIQSMNDDLFIPDQSRVYRIAFGPQGQFSATVDCNNVTGSWVRAGKNQLLIARLSSTRAACAPGSLHDRLMSDLAFTRSFVLEGGHLFLATMADGAILEFAPNVDAGASPAPAFDCSEAEGTVETMICDDGELITLDLYLDELFRAGLANFPGEEIDTYRAFQRGWISGRNECWKQQDVRRCVVDEYLHRISELEVRTGYLTVREPVIFNCPDGKSLSVYFYDDGVLPIAVINHDDRQVFTWRAVAASGSLYQGRNLEFWQRGDEAVLTETGFRQICLLR